VTTGDDGEDQPTGETPDTAGETPEAAGQTPEAAGETPEAAGETPDTAGETPEAAGETSENSASAGGSGSDGYRMRPIDIAAVVLAIVVVLAVVIVIAKGNKKHTTAAPVGQQTATTWVYKDLHGAKVVVVAGTTGSQRFTTLTDGTKVPLTVAAVMTDAQTHNCTALKASYDNWLPPATKGGSSNYQERASAYARYSLDTAKSDHCAWTTTVG